MTGISWVKKLKSTENMKDFVTTKANSGPMLWKNYVLVQYIRMCSIQSKIFFIKNIFKKDKVNSSLILLFSCVQYIGKKYYLKSMYN